MTFNPLKEKGMPIEKQLKSWKELNSKPYDKNTVHPYTRTAGILMNGIEVDAALFSHCFFRHVDNLELKQKLALVRRIEQEQQKAVNWMIPAEESELEVTIGYEQVAVDLTAFLARNEKNRYVKQALDFALLEDFDHLYRYANLMKLTLDKEASSITRDYTDITVGRPTLVHHRHPFDDVRNSISNRKEDPMTILHILTIVAAEQQTMNYYMNIGNRIGNEVGRGLYLEIGQVEEAHVSHYGSLMDPNASWFEQLLYHEFNECWLYYSLSQHEQNPEARKVWERNLEMELEHLRIAADLIKQHDQLDPEQLLPSSFSHDFEFRSNIDYVRDILKNQIDLTTLRTDFISSEKMPKNALFFEVQAMLNSGTVPSNQVIEEVVAKDGHDYRDEVGGPHPIEKFRTNRIHTPH